ncbi:MAG: hypothetical protein KAU16_08990, partial [Methanophagales archaeon]|nr:hypothetical protein [Methanophagales archaeon]
GANALTIFIMNPLFHQVVQFLNKNIVLLIVMFVIFLIGEVFNALIFPLNLPAPLFDAIGSVFLVAFIFRIFAFLDAFTKENIFQIFTRLSFLIYLLVFIIVLLGGYSWLFARLFETDKSDNA